MIIFKKLPKNSFTGVILLIKKALFLLPDRAENSKFIY